VRYCVVDSVDHVLRQLECEGSADPVAVCELAQLQGDVGHGAVGPPGATLGVLTRQVERVGSTEPLAASIGGLGGSTWLGFRPGYGGQLIFRATSVSQSAGVPEPVRT
jgi:hypothetical protein